MDTKNFLQPPLKIITQAAGFAIEKIFSKKDNMTMAELLMKAEPLVAMDPERRVKLWQIVAKDWGSNWDKKIIGIVPTPEEIAAQKQAAMQAEQAKKISTMQQAATEVLNAGGTPEEAKEVGMRAGSMLNNLQTNQQALTQQEQRGK